MQDIHFWYIFTVGVGDLLLLFCCSWRRLRLGVVLLLTIQNKTGCQKAAPPPQTQSEAALRTSSSSSSSEPLPSLSERGATSYLRRNTRIEKEISQCLVVLLEDVRSERNTAFAQIFQTLNLNHFYRNQDRLDAYPGFISSQASSCPALGASTPVRIFPLSTWMTLTGRSLIWLVSSKGWERKLGKPKQQQKNTH